MIRKRYIYLRIYLPIIILIINAFFLLGKNNIKYERKINDECLICHEDENLTMEKNGKHISLYVNAQKFKSSIHGILSCKDCHINYNPEQIPHNPEKEFVNCLTCHDNITKNRKNVHSSINCFDCHDFHYVDFANNLFAKQNIFCLKCHNTKDLQFFKFSTHSRNNVKCTDCHNTSHNILSLENKDDTKVCGRCHLKAKSEFNNSIHKVLKNHKGERTISCTTCHGVHRITKNKNTIESQLCLKCHTDEKRFSGEEKGSAKFVLSYKNSIHSLFKNKGLQSIGCIDCHGYHTVYSLDDTTNSSESSKQISKICGKCHSNILEEYKKSQHGIELLNNNPKAPTCINCHGEHNIKSTSKINQVEICLGCHGNQKLPNKNIKGEDIYISDYKNSYHYIVLKEGKNSASCTDCHGSHSMKKFNDTNSLINERNIQNTCGQPSCHSEQLSLYKGSIHEKAITEKLNFDSPSCVDCHGSHQIMKIDNNNNEIASPKGVIQLCSNCHNSVAITQNNKLKIGVVESFMKSFHGLAIRGGSKVAADCGSCHHYHNIRPSSDPKSTIHINNLAKTCGNCHPGVESATFYVKIHLSENYTENPILFWIEKIYLMLIIVIIGSMFIHNLLDLIRKISLKKVKNDE